MWTRKNPLPETPRSTAARKAADAKRARRRRRNRAVSGTI